MRPLSTYGLLLAALLCHIAGLLMFAKGFFPYKPMSTDFATHAELPPLPGQEQPQAQLTTSSTDPLPAIKPRFGRLVIMLVDALRSDFVYGSDSNFTFVQSLINSQKALPYTAIASAPTVTLPRLKALTTGTVPGFLDAILNIAESDQSSTLASQDNWVAQMSRSPSTITAKGNRTIGFFGDDTWIKLFPGLFTRSEGTSSFFAMDTVEVDLNVTRHVEPEMKKDDWDTLIFHYLGLDHVGHSGGPKSPLMKPKQEEMDKVVETIYKRALEIDNDPENHDLPTLFLLCGDHGMNEVGNHGGSSHSETSTSFLFMSSLFESWGTIAVHNLIQGGVTTTNPSEFQYYTSVNQVDVVPTLSLLLGLPVPKNNVGKLIPELFHGYSDFDQLRAHQVNSFQVATVLKSLWPNFEIQSRAILDRDPMEIDDSEKEEEETICKGLSSERNTIICWYDHAINEHASFLEMTFTTTSGVQYSKIDQDVKFQRALRAYTKFLTLSSSMLGAALSKYDMALLTNGSMVMAFGAIGILLIFLGSDIWYEIKESCEKVIRAKSTTTHKKKSVQQLQALQPQDQKRHPHARTDINWILARGMSLVIAILYLITLFASSFVEEEHQFWYFFGLSWWAVLAIVSIQHVSGFRTVGFGISQLMIMRLLRSWNQTGQKFASEIDLRYYLNSTHISTSWILFFISMSVVCIVTLYVTVSHPMGHRSASGKLEKSPLLMCIAWVLQSIIALVTIRLAVWITVYKMDLEPSVFDEGVMTSAKDLARMLSGVPGGSVDATNGNMSTISGFELARFSYVGMAILVAASFGLEGLYTYYTSTAAAAERKNFIETTRTAAMDTAETYEMAVATIDDETLQPKDLIFLPTMILATVTFLTILLSRRHNAPIFVLFGIQIWFYLGWIRHVRIFATPSSSGTSLGQVNEKATLQTEVGRTVIPIPKYRLLPGLAIIHSTTLLIASQAAFFILGNSNSIASIDISNAYVGIRSYDIVLTGVLTFVSNWSGPIWWCFAGLVVMLYDVKLEQEAVKEAAMIQRKENEEKEWKTVKVWKGDERLKKKKQKNGLSGHFSPPEGFKETGDVKTIPPASSLLPKTTKPTAVEPLEPSSPITFSESSAAGEHATDQEEETYINDDGQLFDDDEAEAQAYEDEQNELGLAMFGISASGEVLNAPLLSEDSLSAESSLRERFQVRVLNHLILSSLFFTMVLYTLSIAAIILRHHLFIWTVFSPKVLYQFAWTVLFQTVFQVVIVGGVTLGLVSTTIPN